MAHPSSLRTEDRPTQRNLRVMRPMLRYLRPYRLSIAGAFIALFFSSAAVLALGSGLRYLVDEGLNKGNTQLLNHSFYILLGVTLLLSLASFMRTKLVAFLGERVVADIRSDVFKRLIAMDIAYFETTRTGELLSRLTTDTTVLLTVISSTMSIAVRNGLMFIGGFMLLMFTSMQLTLYVCFMIPCVVVPIILLGKRVRKLAKNSQAQVAGISSVAEEALSSIRAIQALSLESHELQRFNAQVDTTFDAALDRIHLRAFLNAIVIGLVFGAIMLVLWLGGHDVLSGRITTGQLSSFLFYAVVVAGSVGAISDVVADLQRAAGASERLAELLALTPGLPIAAETKAIPDVQSASFTMEHVHFSYPARPDQPALDDISLAVAPGETVALVGLSGAGKSTMFQLLLRFYDPAQGRICFNGIDLRELEPQALRRAIGFVPQDPVIFSGTAMENIRAGRIEATEEEVREAASAASALEFLEKLPEGLNTFLGEKGVRLSGGQRQRIAIARALVRNPRLLLLDEATSALDAEHEHLIQEALGRLMVGRTTLVIAHRLATVVKADRIVLMHEGRIAAIGTHRELLQASPLYARLAKLQFQSAESVATG